MSQQNVSVIEQHVEKMAIGLGGLLLVVGLALAFSGGDVSGNPKAVQDAADAKLRELNSENKSAMVTAEESKLTLTMPGIATKAVQAPAVLPGLDLAGSSQVAVLGAVFPKDYAPWSPTGTGPDVTPGGPLTEKTFTELPAPTAPLVVSARGVSAKGEGYLGVQVQTNLDTKTILTKWWPMYNYMRANTEAQARRIGVLDPDFSKMERTFDLRWRAEVYAVDVQMQRFDPKTGWERDAQGKDVWTRIESPWGKASSVNWIERVLALESDDGKKQGTKLPPMAKRKDDPQAQKQFNRTLNEMFRMREENYDEIVWPAAPAEGKGFRVFRPNGEPSPDNKWLAPPRLEMRMMMTMGMMKAMSADETDPFADPTDATKVAVKKEETKTVKENVRQLEPSLAQRLGDGNGLVNMSAFVTAKFAPDALLQPGETYRFRTRVLLLNPTVGWQDQAPTPKLENQLFVSTAWSAPSEPVTIPEITRFFVISGDKIGSGPTASVKPVIQIFRWHNGEWFATRGVRIVPGTMIRPERKEDFLRPPAGSPWPLEQPKNKDEAKAKLASAIAMFDTGCLLLEARESATILDREPNAAAIKNPGRADYFTGTRGNKTVVVYMDRHGVIHTQRAAFDKAEMENFLKSY